MESKLLSKPHTSVRIVITRHESLRNQTGRKCTAIIAKTCQNVSICHHFMCGYNPGTYLKINFILNAGKSAAAIAGVGRARRRARDGPKAGRFLTRSSARSPCSANSAGDRSDIVRLHDCALKKQRIAPPSPVILLGPWNLLRYQQIAIFKHF